MVGWCWEELGGQSEGWEGWREGARERGTLRWLFAAHLERHPEVLLFVYFSASRSCPRAEGRGGVRSSSRHFEPRK